MKWAVGHRRKLLGLLELKKRSPQCPALHFNTNQMLQKIAFAAGEKTVEIVHDNSIALLVIKFGAYAIETSSIRYVLLDFVSFMSCFVSHQPYELFYIFACS